MNFFVEVGCVVCVCGGGGGGGGKERNLQPNHWKYLVREKLLGCSSYMNNTPYMRYHSGPAVCI